ncbi:MAG: HlyD family efflux transporter periplasmic adaptor subunit [Gammaproteobacteria bacterium]|nr:HlyD family efflux transporter periplasmic adaptor subunit [Gammaproteobacteria bacterium]
MPCHHAFRTVVIALSAAVVAGCSDNTPATFQGYAEGEYVHIAAAFSGTLDTLAVQRGTQIKAGEILFRLESQNESAARNEAAERLKQTAAQLENLKKGKRPSELDAIRAQQAQAQAALQLSELQLKRMERLLGSGAVTREQLDQARSSYDRDRARLTELNAQAQTARLGAREDEISAAAAEVDAARAALAQAEWRLEQKSVSATLDGIIDDTLYVQGEWVPAGAPVISLLPPQNSKIRFFVPEAALGALHIGQGVAVTCDGCGTPVAAQIRFIASQAEYTPPVIYSKETRSKLVFMVEAWPAPQDAIKLHPGQPVDVALKP